MKNLTTDIEPDPIWFRRAARSGNANSLKYEMDAGVDINNQCPNTGITALMESVKDNKIECFKLILENFPKLDISDFGGFTALHYAASNPNPEFIERLIRAGANINPMSVSALGTARTPLMQAVHVKLNGSLKKFIDLGADLHVITSDGKCALDEAIESGNITAVHIIRTAIPEQNLRETIKQANPNGATEALPAPNKRRPGIL